MPENFSEWDARDKYGQTVAHYVARCSGKLPKGFDLWHLECDTGETVAHFLADAQHSFPEDFSLWGMKGGASVCVVHCVAQYDGTFPPDFDQWDLETDDGEPVIDIAREHGSQHVIAQHQAFLMRTEINEKPVSVAIHRKGL